MVSLGARKPEGAKLMARAVGSTEPYIYRFKIVLEEINPDDEEPL